MDLTDLFRDAAWRCYRPPACVPHWLYLRVNTEGKEAVLVLWRARPNSDWAMSDSALQYFANGVRDGRLAAGEVAQSEGWRVLRQLPVLQVVANIGNTEPLIGRYGAFYWLNEEFKPVGRAGAVSDEEPF